MSPEGAALVFLGAGSAAGCGLVLASVVLRHGNGVSLKRLANPEGGLGPVEAILAKLPAGLRAMGARGGSADPRGEGELEVALLALAAELEGGASVPGALERVEKESPPDLAGELHALREGMVRGEGREALQSWAARRNHPGLEDLSALLEIQGGLGGSMGPTLRKLAEMNRNQRILAAQLNAKSAEARLSARILAMAPVALAGYFAAVHPDLLEPLWTDPLGRWALGYGIVSWVLGLAWIRRLLRAAQKEGGEP